MMKLPRTEYAKTEVLNFSQDRREQVQWLLSYIEQIEKELLLKIERLKIAKAIEP